MKKVFKDEAVQQQFEENGFVILPFYTLTEVNELTNLYHQLHPKDEKGFFPSTFSKDKNYRKFADEEIRRIGNRSIEKYLVDHRVVCGSFIVKSPGAESAMDVHQDMTLVDETEFTGINIWCPLVDLDDTNGLLHALKGSHRLYPTYRGSTVPNLYAEVQNEIKDFMQPVYLKAGEAIFFDQSIIHYSPPNLSDKIRPVTNIYFTHKEARFRICYFDKENHTGSLEIFEQDDNFMTDFEQFGDNIYDRPKIGKSLGLVDYNFPKLTLGFLEQKYERKIKSIKKDNSFFKRVLTKIGVS
ncbi:MAG: phytanoyl-CoA dioxygenase family protein [Bacteroidia bacterium]